MSRLFDISQDFETLFDQFDSISEYEFELNEKGEPIDDDGNVVDRKLQKQKCLKLGLILFQALKKNSI